MPLIDTQPIIGKHAIVNLCINNTDWLQFKFIPIFKLCQCGGCAKLLNQKGETNICETVKSKSLYCSSCEQIIMVNLLLLFTN